MLMGRVRSFSLKRVIAIVALLGGSWALIAPILCLLITYLEDLGGLQVQLYTWGYKYPEPPSAYITLHMTSTHEPPSRGRRFYKP